MGSRVSWHVRPLKFRVVRVVGYGVEGFALWSLGIGKRERGLVESRVQGLVDSKGKRFGGFNDQRTRKYSDARTRKYSHQRTRKYSDARTRKYSHTYIKGHKRLVVGWIE